MLIFIGVTALMIFNLILYHKIFSVMYFDLGRGLLKEIVGAYFVAILEIAIFMFLAQWILVAAVVVVGIAAAIYVIYCIVKFIKKGKKNKDGNSNDINLTKGTPFEENLKEQRKMFETEEKEKSELKRKIVNEERFENKSDSSTIFCVHCGKKIARNAKFCNFCGNKNTY